MDTSAILAEVTNPAGQVRVSWAATTPGDVHANLGDALSPVIVSALSGRPVAHAHFKTPEPRIVSVGSIGHEIKGGRLHYWGTGFREKPICPYVRPGDTEFFIYALRGPCSRAICERQGIHAPEIYGDPVWLLPHIFPAAQEKKYDLGVILHLSDLEVRRPGSPPNERYKRYSVPEDLRKRIRIMDTLTEPNVWSLASKIKEITSCKRIITNSLHGLVLAEAYGIPNLSWHYGGSNRCEEVEMSNPEDLLDPRVRDMFCGVGCSTAPILQGNRLAPTNWSAAIEAVDRNWRPINWTPDAILNAFPLPLKWDPRRDGLFNNFRLLDRIKF